jgi:hypothetical protein
MPRFPFHRVRSFPTSPAFRCITIEDCPLILGITQVVFIWPPPALATPIGRARFPGNANAVPRDAKSEIEAIALVVSRSGSASTLLNGKWITESYGWIS